MEIRAFRKEDAGDLARLSAGCLRGETDFVLNPLWETEDELFSEFDRFGIDPEQHLLVAENEQGRPAGLAGFVRQPDAREAGLFCPVVERGARGRGMGGDLLRAALTLGREKLGIRLVTAAIGTRNRSGYALLTGLGFLPVRQHFMMRCGERPTRIELPVKDLTLAEANPEDLEAMGKLYGASGFPHRTAEQMEQIFNDGIHYHAVATRQGEVVAFAEIETHWPRRVWVAYVGVDTELRNRGLGTSLVAWALCRQFDGRAESAMLLLSPANRTALRAYEKVGFHLHRNVDVLEKAL